MPRVIDRETVEHVARLARLRLPPDELERMREELSGILDHVEVVGGLDLDDVPPTTHVEAIQNVTREDAERPSLSREEALREAPEVADGGFVVRRMGEVEE